MLPLYNEHTYNDIGIKHHAQICEQKTQSVKEPDCATNGRGFSFFKDVISNIIPVLKNLN